MVAFIERHLGLVLATALAAALAACSGSEFTGSGGGGDSGTVGGADGGAGGTCTDGARRCNRDVYEGCRGGKWLLIERCTGGKVCSTQLGRCSDCVPGATVCKGNAMHRCNADGTVGDLIYRCTNGTCSGGTCNDPCSRAAAARSYTGCTYWPTVTANSVGEDFSFAVVVSNPNAKPVSVKVASRNNPNVATTTVSARSVATIKLPWVTSLKRATNDPRKAMGSYLEPAGAYKLTSSLPVTVYQFNPLNYRLPFDCRKTAEQGSQASDNQCFSFSNDASLLLPDHTLTKEYMVIARPTMGLRLRQLFLTQYSFSPGFFAVVATRPGETKVTITFQGNTQAGFRGKLASYPKGATATFTLNEWSVLQMVSQSPQNCSPTKVDPNVGGREVGYCDLSSTTDLTGTSIKADKPVALFSGHACTFVPFDKWACDHLEEQIFPFKSWGKSYVATHPASAGKDPAVYRIVSGEDGNSLTFTPASVHAPVTLGKGRWVEVTTSADFAVKGTKRFAVAQFMVGQNYSNPNPGAGAPGDPAMALAVPVEQYRKDYRFLAPSSYAQNYVNVIAPAGAGVRLDGKDVTGFTAIPGSTFQVAKVKISGGAHAIDGKKPFGIAVYGVGSYTSYMYPGGLDLKLLLR